MRYRNTRSRRGALFCAALLLAASAGPVLAAGGQTHGRSSGRKHSGDWQTVYHNKDGNILIHYPTPDPLSRVYQWQFRSTFEYPVRVDYTVRGFGRSRLGGQLHRTAFIPTHGQTRAFGIPSSVQPLITVQQVRAHR